MAADLDPRFRPPACCILAIEDACRRILPTIREAAHACGYAIGVHGSMARDFDLIAAPWVEEAGEPELLVKVIVSELKKFFNDEGVYWQAREHWTAKPHGRLALTIFFQPRLCVETPAGAFPIIDLSIMPRAG